MWNNKRGQQEILGFVVIVMIVVVIGVVFLGINLRKGQVSEVSFDDAEISNFLSASAEQTSDCIIREPAFGEIGGSDGLLSGCFEGKSCVDGRDSCVVLSEIYNELMASLWPAGSDRPIVYTKLGVYYVVEDITQAKLIDEIISGDESLCVIKRTGRHQQFKSPGRIVVEMSVCSG
jgi:hypothetical protein